MATALDRPPLTREPPRVLTDAELERRHRESFPESAGPGIDDPSGAVLWGAPRDERIGQPPKLLDDATRDRDRAECERKAAVWAGIEKDAADALRKRLEEARA
jgi:hypothetical protein